MPHHSSHHNVRLRLGRLSKRQQKRLLRNTVLLIAITEPIMTAPQVFEIWWEKEAKGVSELTWGYYLFGAFIWLLYGIHLKDRPLIISSALWIVMEFAVTVGAVIYG